MRHARPDYARIQDPAGKIPADEPVFLLRGQDMLAPAILDRYAADAQRAGCEPHLVRAVHDHAEAMRDWQRTRFQKRPDCPPPADLSPAYYATSRENAEEIGPYATPEDAELAGTGRWGSGFQVIYRGTLPPGTTLRDVLRALRG